MAPVLEAKSISKHYGATRALDGVDLHIEPGEIMGFLGANGAGKTTFTNCLTGLLRPDGGSIRICGEDAVAHPERTAKHIGLVPDEYGFYRNMTGRDHLRFYGRLQGIEGRPLARSVDHAIEAVKMEANADKKVRAYSHGMKQRICLAQAIMHSPDLLILDEPTNGLDPRGIKQLQDLMRHFADQGMAVFLSSHLLRDVERVCDRVTIIRSGKVQLSDRVDALQRRLAKSEIRVRLAEPSERVRRAVQGRAGAVVQDGDWLQFPAEEHEVPEYLRGILHLGGRVVEVQPVRRDLESVFLEVTDEPPEVGA